jgi:hypothetical protein
VAGAGRILSPADSGHASAFRGTVRAGSPPARPRWPAFSWLLGVSVREYRELVEGEAWPSYDVWKRIAEFNGWPRAYDR